MDSNKFLVSLVHLLVVFSRSTSSKFDGMEVDQTFASEIERKFTNFPKERPLRHKDDAQHSYSRPIISMTTLSAGIDSLEEKKDETIFKTAGQFASNKFRSRHKNHMEDTHLGDLGKSKLSSTNKTTVLNHSGMQETANTSYIFRSDSLKKSSGNQSPVDKNSPTTNPRDIFDNDRYIRDQRSAIKIEVPHNIFPSTNPGQPASKELDTTIRTKNSRAQDSSALKAYYYPVSSNFFYPHHGNYHYYTTEYTPTTSYGPQVFYINAFTTPEYNRIDINSYYNMHKTSTEAVYLTKPTEPYQGVTINLESEIETTELPSSMLYSSHLVTTEKPSINSWFKPPPILNNLLSAFNRDKVGKPRQASAI